MNRNDMFNLSGKVALVTGGGSGIGRSLCEAMAEYGATVVCCDIDEEGAQETAGLLSRYNNLTLVIRADISNVRQVDSMINETVEKLGAIDILFNNAGIMSPGPRIHETTIKDFDKVIEINLRGVFLCMRAVIPIMIRQKRGSIINTSSIIGLKAIAPPLNAPASYSSTKAGIIALTRQAAREYASEGIRVNAIAPGIIANTNIAGNARKEWSKERLDRFLEERSQHIPLGRVGKPEDLKGIAVYLASDASNYTTGQIFTIDGGLIA